MRRAKVFHQIKVVAFVSVLITFCVLKFPLRHPVDPYAYIVQQHIDNPISIDHDVLQKQWVYNQDDIDIVNAAKAIPERPVMISIVNDAFVPFAFSWLCNTKEMGVHKQVLLIATDLDSKKQINSLWPNISVLVISVDDALQGPQNYSHAGYVRLMNRRTQILKALVDNGIETFMFELDCLWLRNFVPLFHSHSDKYDMLLNGVSTRPEAINGGFLYLFPTDATKTVLTLLNTMLLELDRRLQELGPREFIPVEHNDQEYMSKLVYRHYAGLRFKVFPLTEFADGRWYTLPEKDRALSKITIINFNWIVGTKNKMARAKKFGHWFIKEDNSCDSNTITKLKIPYTS